MTIESRQVASVVQIGFMDQYGNFEVFMAQWMIEEIALGVEWIPVYREKALRPYRSPEVKVGLSA